MHQGGGIGIGEPRSEAEKKKGGKMSSTRTAIKFCHEVLISGTDKKTKWFEKKHGWTI